jgi:YVTN family beta-propeller protein
MSRSSRVFFALPAVLLLTAGALPTAAPAAESAWILHGGDRTLARAGAPSGPVSLNLASVGLFPSALVTRDGEGWVPCGGSDRVDVVDLDGNPGDTPPAILTGAGSNPYGIAFVDDDRAYVTLLTMNAVAAVDPVAGTVTTTIPVGASPQGVAVAAGRVFVANTGFDFNTYGYAPGTVSVVDPGTNLVVATLPVGLNPQNLAISPDGLVHVVCTGNYFSVFGRVFVIDPLAMTVVDSLDVGGSPGFIAINAAGVAYLSDYFLGLLSYDTTTMTLRNDAGNPIPVGIGAAGVDFDAAGRSYIAVYDDDVVVVLAADDSPFTALAVGDGPQDLALLDDEDVVAVTLARFTAVRETQGVRVSWATAREEAHAGFLLERGAEATGPWTAAHAGLLPPAAEGVYEWFDVAPGDARAYRLTAVDRSGQREVFAPIGVVAAEFGAGASARATLAPAAPNPVVDQGTVLGVSLAVPGAARLSIFDAAGREVARPLDGWLDAGEHAVTWNGATDAGAALPRGVYFVRLEAAGEVRTGRLVLARGAARP